MNVGERLRSIREFKSMSQGDIEKSTGLQCSYISRVENGHTVPAVETLERLARALEMPLYQVLYDGDQPPKPSAEDTSENALWGSSGRDARYLRRLTPLLSRMRNVDRQLILLMVEKMAQKKFLKHS